MSSLFAESIVDLSLIVVSYYLKNLKLHPPLVQKSWNTLYTFSWNSFAWFMVCDMQSVKDYLIICAEIYWDVDKVN